MATRNPYILTPPALLSFSGGRTSAFMLRKVLDAHGGTLPEGVRVAFANTGKERPETLEFVHEVETRWSVAIAWVEYRRGAERFAVVDYATAGRNGEPFAAVIDSKTILPNPMMRFCTQRLKIRPMEQWMRSHGYDHWDNAVGLRADEPRRLAKAAKQVTAADDDDGDWLFPDVTIKVKPRTCVYDRIHPLAEAGATLDDVMEFWQASRGGVELEGWLTLPATLRPGWDLALRPDEGNCDLCFLKGGNKLRTLMAANPGMADWWIEQERRHEGKTRNPSVSRFRKDRPSYAEMVVRLDFHPLFQQEPDLLSASCACTD